ncbi:unnamed protein product [Medioppia subpectinata]|uniref:UBA domain-containing protein n=1 Tax=Medioppia subpectinata TaxID=1979941 RepID=A0A7R9KUQ8_9ACAR|nr:unnamed protein product [Medioppia subpectinata]CAG2109829.1 unnamed protein product [Medioppia subpectinata]
MANLLYKNLGFYKIPVTKTLLSSLVLSCGALQVPVLTDYRHLFFFSVDDILVRHKLWPLFVSKLAFIDMKDMSYLLTCFTISSLLELCLVLALNAMNVTNIQYLTPGPFNIIFALFVNYYVDIPALNTTYVLGIPINTKTLTYLLGLQAMISSNSSIVGAISGIITGLICRWNVFRVCDVIKIPKSVASGVSRLFGRLLCSGPPAESPIQMGATFNIIFALFVNYYVDIPALNTTYLLGIPINTKTLTYLLGLQAMISSNSSIVGAISGIITGLICRWNVFHVCDVIKIPKSVASGVSRLFGRLLCSGPPAESPIQMGATFEIQRQQQIELLEQQMLFNRYSDINTRNDLNVIPNQRTNDLSAQTSTSSNSEAIVATNAESVTALVEMGFSRQNVVRALERSNNDMNLATNILLSET